MDINDVRNVDLKDMHLEADRDSDAFEKELRERRDSNVADILLTANLRRAMMHAIVDLRHKHRLRPNTVEVALVDALSVQILVFIDALIPDGEEHESAILMNRILHKISVTVISTLINQVVERTEEDARTVH